MSESLTSICPTSFADILRSLLIATLKFYATCFTSTSRGSRHLLTLKIISRLARSRTEPSTSQLEAVVYTGLLYNGLLSPTWHVLEWC